MRFKKLEINGFDKVLHNFSQIMTNLDVALSKIQLLLENKDLPKFDEVKAEFNLAKKNIDSESFNLKQTKLYIFSSFIRRVCMNFSIIQTTHSTLTIYPHILEWLQ